jgi:plasmid maintenance system antidote protein VapI
MDMERFKQLRDLIGYDNERMAKMFNIEVTEVDAFCTGNKPVPDKLANELELFVDWASEVGDTTVKRELAKKHWGAP